MAKVLVLVRSGHGDSIEASVEAHKQITWPDPQSTSEMENVQDAYIAFPAFDPTYVSPVQPSTLCQFFL